MLYEPLRSLHFSAPSKLAAGVQGISKLGSPTNVACGFVRMEGVAPYIVLSVAADDSETGSHRPGWDGSQMFYSTEVVVQCGVREVELHVEIDEHRLKRPCSLAHLSNGFFPRSPHLHWPFPLALLRMLSHSANERPFLTPHACSGLAV